MEHSVVGSVCAVHRIQYYLPFTSTTRLGQALSSRAAVYRNLQHDGADAKGCPSIKYRKSVVFEFPKEPDTTSNLLRMDLRAGKMGYGRRAVEGAGSTRRAILSARVTVSSYSGEWMEVTSHILSSPFVRSFMYL
jgi:hypothetical protein